MRRRVFGDGFPGPVGNLRDGYTNWIEGLPNNDTTCINLMGNGTLRLNYKYDFSSLMSVRS